MESSTDHPQADREYPLHFGTMNGDDQQRNDEYLGVRLDFVPASANRAEPGTLLTDPENQTATLSLPSTTEGTDRVRFQGKYDPSRDGLDAVAIFDPVSQTFRLEVLDGHVTLRHMPGTTRDRQQQQHQPHSGAIAPTRTLGKRKTAAARGGGVPPPRPKPSSAEVGQQSNGEIADDFFHGGID